MRRCLRATCGVMGWEVGHVYERSPESEFLLIPTGIWHHAEPDTFPRFRKITEHTIFQSGDGLPGRVMASRKPEWVEDVNAEPNFPRAQASGGEEVRGALGFPVLVQGEVAAVLEMFSSEQGLPENPELQSALHHASTQLGRVVERARTAEQLVEAKTYAETANRAKSEFLSAMSHELRTPLNAILGFAQVLRRDRKAALSLKQERSIGHIMKSGHHLLDLISQILELSKIEAGKLDLSMETINSSAAIEDCMTIAHSMAERYGVTVAAMIVEAGWLRISVADTGEGIAAENHARLFEPFDRMGRESTEIEGTGIGLAISRQLMTALGGAIDFESRAGEGSAFWIDLPLAEGDTAVGARDTADMLVLDAPLADMAREYRVMYVEDNLVNLQLMQAIFETIPNAELIVAHDAETGIALARSVMPDIVLMDIGLPGMNGVEATGILKGAEDTRAIPVIAISAAAMVSDLARADSAGFSAYITKPIDIAETLAIINDVLRN
ncbi:MAG: response regulator [Rhodospirillaceae bacterium]|nr:response regulator [Rhodospirillaceae bacterium]